MPNKEQKQYRKYHKVKLNKMLDKSQKKNAKGLSAAISPQRRGSLRQPSSCTSQDSSDNISVEKGMEEVVRHIRMNIREGFTSMSNARCHRIANKGVIKAFTSAREETAKEIFEELDNNCGVDYVINNNVECIMQNYQKIRNKYIKSKNKKVER